MTTAIYVLKNDKGEYWSNTSPRWTSDRQLARRNWIPGEDDRHLGPGERFVRLVPKKKPAAPETVWLTMWQDTLYAYRSANEADDDLMDGEITLGLYRKA